MGNTASKYRISPPDGSREPMRANIFDAMTGANAQLLPLFPYLGEGAIVPAGALMRGGPGFSYGQFFHTNSVDEVAVIFGTGGAMTGAGFVVVGPNTHLVGSGLSNEEDPHNFNLVVITQRQEIGKEQSEMVTLRCEKCKAIVTQIRFDATPPPASHYADPAGERLFVSLVYAAEAAQQHNASEASRTCKRCGTVAPAFPLDRWGWAEYAQRGRAVAEARAALERAITSK
jgi:hypothetical protein